MRIKETVLVPRVIYTVFAVMLAYAILSPVYNSVSGAINSLAVLIGG
jgi:hypothetical protein